MLFYEGPRQLTSDAAVCVVTCRKSVGSNFDFGFCVVCGKRREGRQDGACNGDECFHVVWCSWLTLGLSGAGPRALSCKQDAPSRVHSRPVRPRASHLSCSVSDNKQQLRALAKGKRW